MERDNDVPDSVPLPAQHDAAVIIDADISANKSATTAVHQALPSRPKADGFQAHDTNLENAQPQQVGRSGASLEDGSENKDLYDKDYGIASSMPPAEEEKKKKLKKKRKPASKRGLDKPTGFEDFFADSPLTPEEHAEEQELYDPQLPFVDRILTAIARFERTRKLTPERRDVLYKYLAYGGLTIGPNVGQGNPDTENMSKNEAALAKSQVFITEDLRNLGTSTSLYEVDFLGCAKAFLSRRAKNVWGLETKEQVERICSTLERFMDYLLQHDVCPEFQDDILTTRSLCRTAVPELWDSAEAVRRLPGEFNIACSTLFDGTYARMYDGETNWAPENKSGGPVFVGFKREEAQQIVKFGVSGAATEPVYMGFLAGVQQNQLLMLDVVNIDERAGFEITHLIPPTRQCKEIYTSQSSQFRPVGIVRAKPWLNPDASPEDLSRPTSPTSSTTSRKPTEDKAEYTFLMESITQSLLRVGTKIEATIRTTGCGLMFFDEVITVYPSFDEFIVNELMVGWKAPKPVRGALDYVSDGEGGSDGDEGGGED